MDNGWVKLHRQIFENKLWLAEPFTKAQAWVDLFANACHKPNSFWIRGNEVKLQIGQLGWSEITMAKRWKWSRDKVRRFLTYLEDESNIRQQKTQFTSITTIVNYEKYQDTIQQKNIRQDSRQDTNKKDKKDKNTLEGQAPQEEIVKVIDSFKEVNPAFGKWYGNKNQRQAITRMIETHTLEKILRVVAILPKTNKIPYITNIQTPMQLEDKWSTLEAQLTKEKTKLSKTNKSTPNYVL
jgi:hypothetical protein